MPISYTQPLRRAWQRMQAMLFRPFHLERWLVIGFASFLANLLGHGGGMSGIQNNWRSHGGPSAREAAVLDGLREKVLPLLEKPAVLMAIAIGLVFFGIILLVLAWVSARARFVFLDNVATGRGEFIEPWGRTAKLGHSLFLWYAAFSFAWLVPLALVGYALGPSVVDYVRSGDFHMPSIGALVICGLLAGIAGLLLTFVSYLTREFVVPVMLLHGENATQAWARFWALFAQHPGDFVAYALFSLIVWLGVGIAVVVAGVATCCIGLVLMLIPYVGSVVLLPIEITARGYAPEFLAQYGPEWDLFAARAPRAPDAEPTPPLLG